MCATLRATCGRPNRQSCRFVIAKLAALVPPPRAHLTRFHGVFTPGILPFALRATLRLFKFAPGEFVRQTQSCARS